MTKTIKVGALVAMLLAGSAAWADGARAAEPVQQCEAALAAVADAIEAGVFTNPNTQANLLAKQQAAVDKAADGKTDDAIAKLDDIANTATALASAPKPKLADASAINAAVAAAIACLGSQ